LGEEEYFALRDGGAHFVGERVSCRGRRLRQRGLLREREISTTGTAPKNQADFDRYLQQQIAEEDMPRATAFEKWAHSHILRAWPSVRRIESDAKAAPEGEDFIRYLRAKVPPNIVPHVEMWLHVSFIRLAESENLIHEDAAVAGEGAGQNDDGAAPAGPGHHRRLAGTARVHRG
jgi:hypothetical protein